MLDLKQEIQNRLSMVVKIVSKLDGVHNILDIGDMNGGYVPTQMRNVHYRNVVTLDLHGADFNMDVDGRDFLGVYAGKFDCVVACEIIEHLVYTDRFLKNLKNLLRKGGWLVMTFPNICCLNNRVRVPFGKYPIYAASVVEDVVHKDDKFHVRDFNLAQMRMVLEKNGFKIVKVEGLGFYVRGYEILPGCLMPAGFSNQILVVAGVV